MFNQDRSRARFFLGRHRHVDSGNPAWYVNWNSFPVTNLWQAQCAAPVPFFCRQTRFRRDGIIIRTTINVIRLSSEIIFPRHRNSYSCRQHYNNPQVSQYIVKFSSSTCRWRFLSALILVCGTEYAAYFFVTGNLRTSVHDHVISRISCQGHDPQ